MGFTGQYVRLPSFVFMKVHRKRVSTRTCGWSLPSELSAKSSIEGPDSLWDDHDVLHLSNVAVTILSFAARSSTWPGKLNGRKRNVSIRFHTDDGGTPRAALSRCPKVDLIKQDAPTFQGTSKTSVLKSGRWSSPSRSGGFLSTTRRNLWPR